MCKISLMEATVKDHIRYFPKLSELKSSEEPQMEGKGNLGTRISFERPAFNRWVFICDFFNLENYGTCAKQRKAGACLHTSTNKRREVFLPERIGIFLLAGSWVSYKEMYKMSWDMFVQDQDISMTALSFVLLRTVWIVR